MKKSILLALFATAILSCGEKKKETKEDSFDPTAIETTSEQTPAEDKPVAAEFKKGADLIAASDCLACHKIADKLVGPTYKEVAAKYTSDDEALLVQKIIEGGTGTWGQVPMTPHPAVTKEDAAEMVKYILSLKE
jgi:cytochrome c